MRVGVGNGFNVRRAMVVALTAMALVIGGCATLPPGMDAPKDVSTALAQPESTTLGKRFEPIFITRVTDLNGNPLEFGGTRPTFMRVLSPSTAYVVTSMMQTVVQRGTGRKAAELGRPVAGKTGTTNDTHDAWFIGFTPDLLAGVWVGFDSERSLGPKQTGGRAAAPIWTDFMKHALEGRPVVDFPVPEDVVFAQVDRATGLRAVPGSDTELEVFRRGSEPQKYAAAPEPQEVDADVGAEPDAVPHAEEAVHEIPTETLRPIEEQDLSGTD